MSNIQTWKQFREALADGRRKDMHVIKMHVEDFYDLVDIMLNYRVDAVTMPILLNRGFYGNVDGFEIFCNRKPDPKMLGKYQLGKHTNRSHPKISSSRDPDAYMTEKDYFSLFDWEKELYTF